MEDLAMEVPKMLELAIEHLQLVNRSANWDYESLSIHMGAVEAVVRGWSRSAIIAGIHATTVISLLLLERQSKDFWRLVDEVLLPDAVELCLPQAVLGSEYDPSPCSQRHCRPLWGRDAALVVAAALRNASAVRIFRVEPRRRLLSDNLRSGCRVTCSPRLLEVFQAVSTLDLPSFHYVDVGAALGDCMMMAVYFLKGKLSGTSFEALPVHAQLATETFALGNLRPSLKQLAIGSTSEIQGQVFHGGFGQDPGVVGEALTVRSATLDEIMAAGAVEQIDLLTIFVNHGE